MTSKTCKCSNCPSDATDKVTGMDILAMSLAAVGVKNVYGLAGIPVTEAAYLIQQQGMRFVAFRHEQQAGMAAATEGFLTKAPGVLLTVSSLGFLNGLTATANATVNCYPMIQISGASDTAMVDMNVGTYEQLDQLATARPLVKAAFRCTYARDIPSAVARAYRAAVSGRPGGVYIDMTTPALGEVMERSEAERLIFAPVDLYSPTVPNAESIKRAAELIASARQPVVVVGKGAAYARVDDSLQDFVEKFALPYLPMSMAKGLLPDSGDLCVASCRSTVMSKADVVILVGARLNWLLSFGRDKWNPDARFVQLDVEPQEIDVNRPIAAPVVGDLGASIEALTAALSSLKLNVAADWLSSLRTEAAGKREALVARLNEAAPLVPMTHWSALSAIKPVLETNPDVVLINEGANTLDDTRNAVDMSQPRSRIDCATWAIMGMGMGSAVGAAVATGRRVVAIEGDSAFGFSGIDFSTVCRYRLPVTVVVFNNGGIYNGVGQPLVATDDPAPTTLDINARYDRMGEVFGAASYDVATADHLSAALTEALASRRPAIINVRLAADSGQESGHIGYLNPTPLQLIKV